MRLSILDLAPVPPGGSTRDALMNSISLAQAAERLGYHRYWVAEHHGIGASIANSCPAVVIARIAAATRSIRVGSGAVLLDYTSPLMIAEQFATLDAYFPDRIDLGIGRAASNSPRIDSALRPGRPRTNGGGHDPLDALTAMIEHEAHVADVRHWLETNGHPTSIPSAGPAMWLLGASMSSAALAGRLGLPYCYAAFINPADAPAAIALYRGAFRPTTGSLAEAYAMVSVSLCCAGTDAEADHLRASAELFDRGLAARAGGPDAGVAERLAGPDSAVGALGSTPPPTPVPLPSPWPMHLSGGPRRSRAILDFVATTTGADEIMIHDLVADHASRLRSHELLAAAHADAQRATVR